MRRWLALLAVVAALAPGGARAGDVVVEAEDGSIDTPLCGDDRPGMRELANTEATGGATVFHPGTRCTQTFSGVEPRHHVTSIRFYLTGEDGVLCGRFLLTGGIVGTTQVICEAGAKWLVAPVYGTHRVGSYSITWITEPETSQHVNAFVDHHTGN